MFIKALKMLGNAILWLCFAVLVGAFILIVCAIVYGFITYNPPKNSNVHRTNVTRHVSKRHIQSPKNEIHGKFYSKHLYKASTGYGSMEATPTKQSDDHNRKLVTENAKAYINSVGNRSDYLTYTAPVKVISMMNDKYYNDITHVTETTVFFVRKNAVKPATKQGAE